METKSNNWLCDYRKRINSQSGEDGVIEKIFEVIGTANKWCVEFGASSGNKGNNTWRLIKEKGWSAVLLEAERALYHELCGYYSDDKQVVCLNETVSDGGLHSLDNILQKTNIPVEFDFVSVDIDGHDYHVWEAVVIYRPRVVMIEINPGIPLNMDFIQPKDIKTSCGSSLSAINKLAQKKGYQLIFASGVNAIFVREDLYDKFGIADNSPKEILCAPESGGLKNSGIFFQFYDGSIVLLNVPRTNLLAYRKKIKEQSVWVWENDKLYPVNFTYDRRLNRFAKNFIKKTFLYVLLYSLVKIIYGWMDRRKKRNIKTV